ncbi:MAG: hypothetical protein AAGE94_19290 [Acidobacteriota bacterium]
MWPDGFRPASPGQRIPKDRDSTDYISKSHPGAASGHELWFGVDIAADRLFAYYNAGIAVFDIASPNQERPVKLGYVDTLEGDFLYSDTKGETDGYLTDIAVIANPANSDEVLIALAGNPPIGITLWRFTLSTNRIDPLYQDRSRTSNQVRLLDHAGTIYAVFASPGAAAIYDLSAANQRTTGCLEAIDCPAGIYRGLVGDGAMAPSRFVDVLGHADGVFVVGSMGRINPGTPPPEIWRLSDPANPTAASRRFRGLDKATSGVTFIEKDGHVYLAADEARTLRIWQIDPCLAGACSTDDFDLQFATPASHFPYDAAYLTLSDSLGTPFLYYGVETASLRGRQVEQLLDLTTLGGTNAITEITASGGTYTDACGNEGVGYWSHMYARNANGYRGLSPRIGLFNGAMFYRAAVSVVDVHIREAPAGPTFTTSASGTGFTFGTPITFEATAANCPDGDAWSWFPEPSAMVETEPDDTSRASITWDCLSAEPCPPTMVSVRAIQDACLAMQPLIEHPAQVTLRDPRVFADGFDTGQLAAWSTVVGATPTSRASRGSGASPPVADDDSVRGRAFDRRLEPKRK